MRRFEIGVSEAIPAAIRVYVPGREICPMARVLLLLVGLLCGPLGPSAAECTYHWIQIPNPGVNQWCYGTAINAHGHVAGYVANLGDNYRGFIWTPETGTRVLPMPAGIVNLVVTDLNDLGHAVGYMDGSAGHYGFLWDGSSYTLIEHPIWATQISVAGVNNQDVVVGTVNNSVSGPVHAFRWQVGTLEDLGPSVSKRYSYGSAINNAGVLMGIGQQSDWSQWRSFVISAETITWLPHPDGFDSSFVVSASNNGFFTGSAKVNDPVYDRGVIWMPWGIEIVVPPPGLRDARINDINDFGRAVGTYSRPGAYGFVWQGGLASDLTALVVPPLSSGHLTSGVAINNHGQIIGKTTNGAIILTPSWASSDLTGDCQVGLDDLLILLAEFGALPGAFPRGDLDADGDVDLSDLTTLLSQWGT